MTKKLNRKYFESIGLHCCNDAHDKEQVFHDERFRLFVNNVDGHSKAPYKWYVEIHNDEDETIGTLDCAYVDEFEMFLKLCRYEHTIA